MHAAITSVIPRGKHVVNTAIISIPNSPSIPLPSCSQVSPSPVPSCSNPPSSPVLSCSDSSEILSPPPKRKCTIVSGSKSPSPFLGFASNTSPLPSLPMALPVPPKKKDVVPPLPY